MPRSEPAAPRRRDANRRRDASRTRADLLAAASELFGQQGYSATTLRAIGERAGVDPALIARYFGNKLSIYLAALEDSPPPDVTADPVRDLVERMVERNSKLGATPISRVAVAGTDDDAVHAIVSRIIQERTIAPMRERLEADGVDRAQLRSELALAAALGVTLSRSAGTLTALSDASDEEIIELCTAAVEAVLGAPRSVEQHGSPT